MAKQKTFLKKDIALGGTSLTQRALMAKHLSVMEKAGLNISEALEIVVESSTGRMKKIMQDVLRSVESGNSLAESFARHDNVFSGIFISAIYAGERSGTLAENLENLAEQMKKDKELISKIRGALLYPVIVLIAAFVLGISVSFLVLPKIVPLFEGLGSELPLTTRMLISFSYFIEAHGLPLFLGIMGGTIFLVWLLRRKFVQPMTHWLLLKIPVLKHIIINSNLSRFSHTLGILLKSGINISEALDITQRSMTNYYYRRAVKMTAKQVGTGSKISVNLERYEQFFPAMVTKMVMVGERSGNLEETLMYLAEYYEAELDNATKNLSNAIEPMLLIFIGLIVGFLALSIITPIYNITGNISR